MSMKRKILSLAAGFFLLCLLLLVSRHRSAPGEHLTAGFDAEFLTRPDGYPGLCVKYGFQFPHPPRQMDSGLMYRACADGAVDVINGFATDGRIPAYNLKVLEDDLGFFPPYHAAPLVRAETLREHPELQQVLERLSGQIDDQEMRQLNLMVDEKGMKARDVARDYLQSKDLLKPGSGSSQEKSGKVVVGGKQFTEQEILGEMLSILIEDTTDLKVTRRLNLGGTMICFNALKAGDLDLYVEYTGTGLMNILKRDPIRDPDEAFRQVHEAFQKEYDLLWLKPFGFNNTYTLTMKTENSQALGIESISDLVAFLSETGVRP